MSYGVACRTFWLPRGCIHVRGHGGTDVFSAALDRLTELEHFIMSVLFDDLHDWDKEPVHDALREANAHLHGSQTYN